jgi:hypothetical protein
MSVNERPGRADRPLRAEERDVGGPAPAQHPFLHRSGDRPSFRMPASRALSHSWPRIERSAHRAMTSARAASLSTNQSTLRSGARRSDRRPIAIPRAAMAYVSFITIPSATERAPASRRLGAPCHRLADRASEAKSISRGFACRCCPDHERSLRIASFDRPSADGADAVGSSMAVRQMLPQQGDGIACR